jgi:hypothetical protein
MNRRQFLFASVAMAAPPLTGLRVSDNQRFLRHADGRPFFYLADTAWELFHRLDKAQTIEYLDNRAAKGFTVIQAVALAEFDGLTEPNAEGNLPLENGDPRRPVDAYFRHIDWVFEQAARRGLFIGLLPTWGNKVVQAPWEKKNEVIFDGSTAYDYGKWIGARYAKVNNLIWILGGDRNPNTVVPVWREMARGIREKDTSRHLMTYHPQGNGTSSESLHGEPWLDFNMMQSGHGKREIRNDLMVAKDYALVPIKPVIDGEPRYEDHPVNWKPDENGWFDDIDVRQAAYWAVFAGAAGHTYGCHDIWQFFSPKRPPISLARTEWQVAMNLPGATQMGHLRRLMEGLDYFTRLPDQTIIEGPDGEGGEHMQATRGRNYAMVYTPTGKPFSARLERVAAKKVRASWFNPRNGSRTKIGDFDGNLVQEFTPPGKPERGNDWVLLLEMKP